MKKLALCVAVVLMASVIASAGTNGLLAYWNFEGTANDVSGYGTAANLTMNAGATLVSEGGRNALLGGGYVDSTKWDDRVLGGVQVPKLDNNPALSPGNTGLTYSFWTKPQNVNQQWTLAVGFDGWGLRVFTMDSGYIADLQTSQNGWNPGQAWQGADWSGGVWNNPSLAWHHIVYTYDHVAGRTRGYIDGVLKTDMLKTDWELPGTWWADSTDRFFIAKDPTSAFIDDVMVFSGACNDATALGLYNGTYDAFSAPINVPEPTTMALLGLGAISLIRRKK